MWKVKFHRIFQIINKMDIFFLKNHHAETWSRLVYLREATTLRKMQWRAHFCFFFLAKQTKKQLQNLSPWYIFFSKYNKCFTNSEVNFRRQVFMWCLSMLSNSQTCINQIICLPAMYVTFLWTPTLQVTNQKPTSASDFIAKIKLDPKHVHNPFPCLMIKTYLVLSFWHNIPLNVFDNDCTRLILTWVVITPYSTVILYYLNAFVSLTYYSWSSKK